MALCGELALKEAVDMLLRQTTEELINTYLVVWRHV
jgi:hypothetical protein